MATLDPRFYCTSDVDTYYVDNASGLPMSGGIVTFYSDVNRTVLKPVYQLTGTPGNYTFAPLNDPCTLSSSGTFQDGLGNNIVPYYYPFTGTPAQNTGVQELYYITVVNSGFVPQLVRQAWPPAVAQNNVTPVTDEQIDNFIPNGQFLAHTSPTSVTEPPITQLTFAGPQTIDIQPIAQGGWYFAYTDGNMATFTNSFSQIPSSGGWGSVNYPKYVFNFVCKTFDATAKTRDLWITWPDINKFSSNPGPYTLYFDARSNDGNSYVFSLYQVYYFGSGSVSPGIFSTNPIATITIGPGATLVSQNIQNITWLTNQGTIGPNGDDFVGLALRGPASGWNVSVSDFVLAEGNETFTSFPIQTNDQMLSRGVAGFMPTPAPDGSDLYLPLILTPQGLTFNTGQVGEIIASLSPTAPAGNYLSMDGSGYLFSQYSSIGIPYKRLGNFLTSVFASYTPTAVFPLGCGIPLFGSGVTFVNAYGVTSHTNEFLLYINAGMGVSPIPAIGTAPLTLTASSDPSFTFTLNSVPTAGEYFTFSAPVVSPQAYYVWFTVNGAGTNPAPGGIGIVVNVVTADTVATTVVKILNAINQYMFATFNIAGYFLRAYDVNGVIDPDYNTRIIAGLRSLSCNFVGSTEAQAFLNHTHNPLTISAFFGPQTSGTLTLPISGTNAGTAGTTSTSSTGGDETRPINFSTNFFIKY